MDDTRYVHGAARLKTRIDTIRRGLGLPLLMPEIQTLLLKRTKDRFAREVDPDGKPWVPLHPATLARKQRLGYGDAQKLVRTGKMRDSIKVIRGGLGSTFFNTGAGFRIGIQDEEVARYAIEQNKGTEKIPARRFLGLGRLDIKAVDSLLRRKAVGLGL